jgi:hypothetical protein
MNQDYNIVIREQVHIIEKIYDLDLLQIGLILMTPYGAAQLINQTLRTMGSEKVIRPQMVYNYVKKGYIPSSEGRVSYEDLMDWFQKYCEKNVTLTQPTLF